MTFPNWKVYIGITCKALEKRIAGHVNRTVSNIRRDAVHHAIAKYGTKNVIIDKLQSKESIAKREPVKAEKRLIDKFYGLRDSTRIKRTLDSAMLTKA